MNKVLVKKTSSYRWVIWGVLAIAFLIVYFHRLSVGVVKDELINEFGITGTTFANIGAMYFYAYMLMQIPSGILADTLGARKTVTIGMVFAGVGSIIFGFAPSIFWAYLGRLLVGLGVSVVFISILKILSEWYKESEFGTMSGLTSFVGNLGGLIAQTPLALLVIAITWRNSFAVIGVFSIIIAILCYILVRNKPTDMGLPDIEGFESDINENHNEGSNQIVSNKKPKLLKSLVQILINKRTWPAFFLFAGFYGAFTSLTGTWGTSYMIDVYEITKISAANYMLAAVLGLAVGSVIIGKISDIMKSRKIPMISLGVVYIISWAIIVFVNGGKPPIEIMMPLMFILGFSSSAFVLVWACVKEVNPREFSGTSTSVANIGGFFGAAILPVIIGNVIDKQVSTTLSVEVYHNAFIYCFLASLIGFIFIFFIKETNCKNIYKEI